MSTVPVCAVSCGHREQEPHDDRGDHHDTGEQEGDDNLGGEFKGLLDHFLARILLEHDVSDGENDRASELLTACHNHHGVLPLVDRTPRNFEWESARFLLLDAKALSSVFALLPLPLRKQSTLIDRCALRILRYSRCSCQKSLSGTFAIHTTQCGIVKPSGCKM